MAMPPTREAAVKALLERGKKKGSLTYDEIAAVSAAFDEDDPERGNELVEEIIGQGIEITEMPELVSDTDDKPEAEVAAIEESAEEISLPPGLALDDPVRMYLKEIGRVPLLGMAQEQELARAIELQVEELERARQNGVPANQLIVDN